METLNALLAQLNLDYPGAKPISNENSALLKAADAAALKVGHEVWFGDDDLWYSIDAGIDADGKG